MATEQLTMFLMAIVPQATESDAAGNRMMTVVVELALTYLIHSTLFIGTAWILLGLSRRFRSGQRGLSPANEERLWKFVTVLALVTVPVSQYSGWSWSIWQRPSSRAWQIEPSLADTDAKRLQAHDDFSRSKETSGSTSLKDESVMTPGVEFLQREEADLIELVADDAVRADASTAIRRSRPTATPMDASTTDLEVRFGNDRPSFTSMPANDFSNVDLSIPQIPMTHSDGGAVSRSTLVIWSGTMITVLMSIGAMRLAFKAIGLHRFLRRCLPAPQPLQKSLPSMKSSSTAIRLLTTDSRASGKESNGKCSIIEPFACGIWNWTIVVPRSIERELPPDELRALLAHEVAHLVRRDPLWQWVNEFLCVCLPFQPLHFLVRRRWRRIAELMCDDWVVEQQISPLALARCLSQIAELRLGRRPAFGMSAVDRSSGLTSRIEWLLRDRPVNASISRRGQSLITVIAFLLGVCVGVYGPRITLTSVTLADDQSATDTEYSELESEMQSALSELGRIESQLSQESDPEIRAMSNRLRQRTGSLRSRWKELR